MCPVFNGKTSLDHDQSSFQMAITIRKPDKLCIKWSSLVENLIFGSIFEWVLPIQKTDTNFVRKMTIRKPDHPVFKWSLYSGSVY
jgi:hypothetical protein